MFRATRLSRGRKSLLYAVAVGLSLFVSLSALTLPDARADEAAAQQQRIDAAVKQLVEAVSRTQLYLAWYDQANRMLVAEGRMSAAEADAALAAKAAAVTRSGFADAELAGLADQQRATLRDWFASIERAAGAAPATELWPGQARETLERLRREYETWVAERLDPLPLLQDAAKLATRAKGTPDPFVGQNERIIAAFPQPLARTVLGPLLSEATASEAAPATGTDAAAASGTNAATASAAVPTSGSTAGAVQVTSASYGANCGVPDDNALSAAQRQCDGRPGCEYVVDPGAPGDAAPSCRKDFAVRWTCTGIAQGGERLLRIPGEAAYAVASLSCLSGGPGATASAPAGSERPVPGEMGAATPPPTSGDRPVPGEMATTSMPSTSGERPVPGETSSTGERPAVTAVPQTSEPQSASVSRGSPLSGVITVTDSTFGPEILQPAQPALVAFCLPTAVQCAAEGTRTLETVARNLGGLAKVARLDLWQDIDGEQHWTGRQTFEGYAVDVVPTFILFIGGQEGGRFAGEIDAEILVAWVFGMLGEDDGSSGAQDGQDDFTIGESRPDDASIGEGHITITRQPGDAPPATGNCTGYFTGVWQTNYGVVSLSIKDDFVYGDYTGGGRIEGHVQGDTFVGRWSDGTGTGTLTFKLASDRLSWEGPWQRETGSGNPSGIWYGSCEPPAPDGPTVMRTTPATSTTTIEPSTDRPGQDYVNFELSVADHLPCQAACNDQEQCRAWTYVQPGLQGANAHCWLKSDVPAAHPNQCCVSGVKDNN